MIIYTVLLYRIGGGWTASVVKWLKIKSNVDHAAYVREVRTCVYVCVHVYVCVCVCACVSACVCACVCEGGRGREVSSVWVLDVSTCGYVYV